MTDPYVGRLSFFRVYSGHLTTGSSVLNSTKNVKERIGRILQMHANHREDIEEVFSGDIEAAVGLKLSLIHISFENPPVNFQNLLGAMRFFSALLILPYNGGKKMCIRDRGHSARRRRCPSRCGR